MKTVNYNRTPILNFCELEENEQAEILKEYDISQWDEVYDANYVRYQDEILPLNMFMKTDRPGVGIYGQTYFSAYFIYLGRTGEDAVVAYRYN